ncbi:MAG: hypothetical protein ACRDE2_10310 [Chitinophagaceae bacterium]
MEKNSKDLTSEVPFFYNASTGEEVNIDMDTISSQKSLERIIQEKGLKFTYKTAPDSQAITSSLIEKNINAAFSMWKKYPWNANVPENIFFNYLLPYKICNEMPGNWRAFFSREYKLFLNGSATKYKDDTLLDPNLIVKAAWLENTKRFFKYNVTGLKLDPFPGLKELLAIREGDCTPYSTEQVYLMRSLGIPATIDLIPYWGKGNAGHAALVFWNTKKHKMTCIRGEGLNPPGYSPAKVFRLSFKRQTIWQDSIRPYVDPVSFVLKNLENNHWIDATGDHVKVADVAIPIKDSSSRYAYICVFNYAQWVPIYWGRYIHHEYLFKNMGCDILYRVALPASKTYRLTDHVFYLDSGGVVKYIHPDLKKRINLTLHKLNIGRKSWVQQMQLYTLKYLSNKGMWMDVGTKKCQKDSVISFTHVPTNTFYRLLKDGGLGILGRPFLYKNKTQEWY